MNEQQEIQEVTKKKKWLNYEEYNIFHLIIMPFVIYGKQFLKYFIFSVIPELLIFGIFYLIIFRFEYIHASGTFVIQLDFRQESAAYYFFILVIAAVLLVIMRSAVITTMTWKTVEKSKANPFWALEVAFKHFKQLFLAALMIIFALVIPIGIFILAVMIEVQMPGFAWMMISLAAGIPLILGSKICLFNVSITKDEHNFGRAFQSSWYLTTKANWIKTMVILTIYVSISIALPWALTNRWINIYGDWVGIVMIFGRALLYPLFDISLTLTHLHSDSKSLNEATFKDDILKRREISRKYQKV